MALSDVLNNLTGARDALVTAINNKGGTVATTATLRQCAEAVTNLPEGGGDVENDPVFDGLIFYLSFDRWMMDSVSDLKIPFSDIETEPGKNDLCGQFDGRSSWAAIPKEKISIRGRSEWSVGFWFKPEQLTQTTINPVYAEWNESDYGSTRFSVQISNELKIFSQINFTDGQDVDLMRVERDTPLVVGGWYYISVTVNLPHNEMRLYVDGELVSSDSNAESPSVSPSSLPYNDPQLMNWFTGETNPSSGREPLCETAGSLDEFAFWGRALSADEVAALYNSGNGLFYENNTNSAGGGDDGGGDDGGSGESGGGGEGGGNSIYTGDLVATVYGTPVGDITATLTCVTPDAIRQNDVVWEGKATAIIDYSFSVNTYSGKWSLNVDTDMMGDIAYGGDNFTTDNSVPWGATWTNTGGTSRTCEVSKA